MEILTFADKNAKKILIFAEKETEENPNVCRQRSYFYDSSEGILRSFNKSFPKPPPIPFVIFGGLDHLLWGIC